MTGNGKILKEIMEQYMVRLPKAQGGLIVPRMAPVYDNIPNPASFRAKAEMNTRAQQNAAYKAMKEKQGEIRPAGPKRSPVSKAWAVATNPMTALKYKVKGQNIPDNFEKGERNNLDLATDLVNPFTYMNAAGNAVAGAGRVAMNPMTAMDELPGIALNTLGSFPVVAEAYMLNQFASPIKQAAMRTFRATPDLPLGKRIRNAANAGSLELDVAGDVPSHTYFNMTPDAVKKEMSQEMINLPRGAYSKDGNMSKNSAPLYWTQAARSPKEFSFIRTGETQDLNWAGTQGKRVASAVPQNAMNAVPEIQDIAQAVNDRINYLKSLNDPNLAGEIARLQKEGLNSAIVGEMRELARNSPQGKELMLQFMKNYKPTLDNPIMEVNRRTGLNFPLTKIGESWLAPSFVQPTIYAVKGDPIKNRLLPAFKQHFADRAERWYLGDMFKNKASSFSEQLPDPPEYLTLNIDELPYRNGGPIVDPRGQWAYPGMDTIVPTASGGITMQGVPYPVYGQDETGYGQMMMPGGEYQFPGQMVYEKPMMKSGGQHGGLDRWFAEKWVDIKTGKACGRQEGESRKGYPACRPSRRVSEDTPKTASELSSSEREKFKRSKTSSERINYQHRRMEDGGEQTESTMANKPNNPSLWSRAKSLAKQKFDVYPSAYANGWAAKWYKSKGGSWRKAEYGMEIPMMAEGGKPDWLVEAQLKAQGYSGNALEQKMSSMAQGGEPQNAGFQALPEYVQDKIMNAAFGGYVPEMAYGGAAQQAAIAIAMKKAGKKPKNDDLPKAPFGMLLLPGIMNRANKAMDQIKSNPMLLKAMAPGAGGLAGMMQDGGEPDGSMALGQIDAAMDKLQKLRQFIQPDSDLEPWVSSKLTLMDHYTDAVSDYMMYNPEAKGEEMEMMRNGGYVVTRSNDRKGKTHKVTGPDGTVKYFGDSKLGQHPKDPERKKAFYARHKKNLEGNPYFRAFARATWAEGGQLPTYQNGEQVMFPTTDPKAALQKAQEQAAIYTDMNLDYFNRMNADGYLNPKNIRKRFEDNLRRSQMLEMINKTGPQYSIDSKFGNITFTKPILSKEQTGSMDSKFGNTTSNLPLYVPEYAMGGMPCYECGGGVYKMGGGYGTPSKKKGKFTQASQPMMQSGGPVVGDEMDVTPEQLEQLRAQGYQFEII
jgi:hypothetical protein